MIKKSQVDQNNGSPNSTAVTITYVPYDEGIYHWLRLALSLSRLPKFKIGKNHFVILKTNITT